MRKAIDDITELMRPHVRPEHLSWVSTGGNRYEWYFTVAAIEKPRRIIEIGVRNGYSAMAMILGHAPESIVLVDSEYDGVPLTEAVERIGGRCDCIPLRLNSQEVEYLPLPASWLGSVGVAHVDGWHSVEGVQKEIALVMPWMVAGGLIVVDDCKHDNVWPGVETYLRLGTARLEEKIDSVSGHWLLRKT